MIKEQIPIIPGSMLSDISPNEMGEHEHLEVVNLRRNRIGEWESVPGYVTILENSGYSGITTAIEVTDDLAESGDSDAVSGYGWKRFILYHDNTGQIRRVMYTASGYDISTDELVAESGDVSGVDVPGSGIRFFYHNGIVRITGTTEPLWYGRIDREYVHGTTKKWVLDKTGFNTISGYSGTKTFYSRTFKNLYYQIVFSGFGSNPSGINRDRTTDEVEAMEAVSSSYHYYKLAFIYDDYQVSLMQLVNNTVISDFVSKDNFYAHSSLLISIPISMITPRLTGVALCVGNSEIATTGEDDIVVYKIVDFVVFEDDPDKVQKKYFELSLDGTTTDQLSYSFNRCTFSGIDSNTIGCYLEMSFKTGDGNEDVTEHPVIINKFKELNKLIAFLHYNLPCTLVSASGTTADMHVHASYVPGFTTGIKGYASPSGTSSTLTFLMKFNESIPAGMTTFKTLIVKRLGVSGASYAGYVDVPFGFDHMDWDGYDYHEYADIPAGTDNISPNYSHHIVIGDRAYVTSLENEEEDFVRYSAQNKFDVFPDTNLISTGAGDLDRNMVIVARDDKFMILKRNSITQGQMTGETYFQDTAFTRHGLYPLKGYIVLDHILYVMEKDDIYAFAGTEPEPLMGLTKIREFYRANVDENSFFAFDNQNNELWVILNGHVLVWNRNYNDWYIRLDDFSFAGYFNDSETRLIGYGVSGGNKSIFAVFNHDSAWFSESINWSFRTKFQDNQHPELYKKLDEILVWQKGNVGTSYSGYDNQTNDVFAGSFPPSPSGYSGQLASPFFPYHELIMVFSGSSGYSGMEFSMKKSRLNIGRWGNGI